VSRRSLFLGGCAPAPRAASGVLGGGGAPRRDGERAHFLDDDGLTLDGKRRATAAL